MNFQSGAFQDLPPLASATSSPPADADAAKLPPLSAMSGEPYVRLFPRMPEDGEDQSRELWALALDMTSSANAPRESGIPAGYTYWGQFIAHDLSLAVPAPWDRDTPRRNARSARLDLECLFGRGPRVDPHLYRPLGPPELLVDNTQADLDLPRNASWTAVVADGRNDDNVMIAQVHLALSLAYNRLTRQVFEKTHDRTSAHATARRELTWTYQWLVLHDYLPRILDAALREDLERVQHDTDGATLRSVSAGRHVRLPLEFTFAALRFGHSMVRSEYELNDTSFGPFRLFPRRPSSARDSHLRGSAHLPPRWTIDWNYFFDDLGSAHCQFANAIDTHIASPLSAVQVEGHGSKGVNLAFLTLSAGFELGLPTAEWLAEHRGVQLPTHDNGPTPLWWAILAEAAQTERGTLGRFGSGLILSTFQAMLQCDHWSYLAADPTFEPRLASTVPGLLRWGQEDDEEPGETDAPGRDSPPVIKQRPDPARDIEMP